MAGRSSSPHCRDRAIQQQQEEPQEKEDYRLDPYSLFISQGRLELRPKMFSMGREELGCSIEGVQRPELISWEVNNKPEHLYDTIEMDKRPSELLGCRYRDELHDRQW
jgi:hypothetical protein